MNIKMDDLRQIVFATLQELGHSKVGGIDIVSLMSFMYTDYVNSHQSETWWLLAGVAA